MILWETDAKVDLLRTAVKSQGEEHLKALELTTQAMAKLGEDIGILVRGIVQLSGKFETFVAKQNPPGFCQRRSCAANCDTQLKELRANTDKQIDYRFAEEKLKRYGLFS